MLARADLDRIISSTYGSCLELTRVVLDIKFLQQYNTLGPWKLTE